MPPAERRRLGGRRLGMEAAARRLGVHPEAVRALVRAGALARCRRGGVDPASVDRFARDFVAAAALARMQGRRISGQFAEV